MLKIPSPYTQNSNLMLQDDVRLVELVFGSFMSVWLQVAPADALLPAVQQQSASAPSSPVILLPSTSAADAAAKATAAAAAAAGGSEFSLENESSSAISGNESQAMSFAATGTIVPFDLTAADPG